MVSDLGVSVGALLSLIDTRFFFLQGSRQGSRDGVEERRVALLDLSFVNDIGIRPSEASVQILPAFSRPS